MKFRVRIFNFKGRNLRLSFSKWRERREKGAFLRYYRRQPGEDARSALGRRLDVLVGLLLAWLAVFFLLASLTGRPRAALALSAVLLAAALPILKKLKEKREYRHQLQRRFWLAGQRFMEDILKMDQHREFKAYVRDILAGLPGFQEVRLAGDGKDGSAAGAGIDLEGIYRGVPVAVRCVRQEADGKIAPDDIRAFAGAMHLGGYRNGLFVTLGSFAPGAASVVKKAARRGLNIKLADRYRLIDLARQAGAGAFLSGEEPPAALAGPQNGRLPAAFSALRDAAFGSRKKARSYFWCGLLLFGGYVLLKDSAALSLVYLFGAVLNLLLGAGCLYFGKTLEEADPLEGLGTEK
ncbi:hypothetical protein PTH_2666 [Pelotomaculum thermopropionicum SI]|uniref:Restriction endonuclease type IV Mrr domain-containing protein n=1 Tax=Pelotomaculum thermopropionicum (strain DSM 13744 / JCM 10971 / SI) TaxID=370438 RepID=A5CYT0_PELTS|nr:hypothetical protein PTH_2666 [Pelotomaculum thermopropionicum SI]